MSAPDNFIDAPEMYRATPITAPTTRETADHAELARIEALLREHIRVDASGLAPAVVSHFVFGFDTAASALLSEIAALRGEVDVLEVEKIGLRAAIFGSHDYDPSLRHGNFIEMARQTEEARKGALSRATQAERQRDELRKAALRAMTFASLCVDAGELQPDDAENPADLWDALNATFLANQGADQ